MATPLKRGDLTHDTYPTSEAADLLNLKQASVRIYISRGLLYGEKRGRDWYIDANELVRFSRERRTQARRPNGRERLVRKLYQTIQAAQPLPAS